jgi:hypothetical protein
MGVVLTCTHLGRPAAVPKNKHIMRSLVQLRHGSPDEFEMEMAEMMAVQNHVEKASQDGMAAF